ncbi:Hypothetical protein, putative [Bodo saltans]|uniref:Uncharacterized protein n=1 Tax=Bodo saltans TaxID=75058 RepID=A0A0S4J4X2_BODSA|nr:Hypothetical protein, putative [Bodo saltans]|eukprot:CUG84136.1 Hypothetical protein, putative [Bodo saltans]
MAQSISITPALLSSVRAGSDAFLQLQRMRIAAHETPILHFSRRAASEQSYSRLDAPLGDERDVDTEIIWDLVNRVLGMLEAGVDATDAALSYATWYRTYFTSIDELHKIRDQIVTAVPSAAPEALDDLWASVLVVILRSFLAGHLDMAAGLTTAALGGLRHRGIRFSPEDEACFSDIIRLMTVEARTASQFLNWRDEASRLINDARYTFSPEKSTDDPQAPQSQLRALALDLLVMMSGDIPLVLDSCNNTGVDALGFACALCSLIHPFTTLDEVHKLFKTAVVQAEDEGHWMNPAVEAILGCQTTTDFISAMEVLHNTADQLFGPRSERSGADESEAEEVRRDTELKRFCLSFMTAHVADICLPSIIPTPPHTDLLFIRNHLVDAYVSQFIGHSSLWATGLTYTAFSPLQDPRRMQGYITEQVSMWCTKDVTVSKQYHQFYRNHLEPGSPLQRELRQTLRAICDGASKTLEQWIHSFDEAVQYANFFLNEAVIHPLWNSGRHAEALWEAVLAQQTGLVQRHIGECLAREDVLVARAPQLVITHVGEAVQNGLIPLDRCPNGNLSTMLRLTSALVDVLEQPVAAESEPLLTSSSAMATQLPTAYATFVGPRQRLASTEYILQHGLDALHTVTLIRVIRGSLQTLEREFHGDANQDTVNHLLLVNASVNKLCCRAKATTARKHHEGQSWTPQLSALRVQVTMRIAAGR